MGHLWCRLKRYSNRHYVLEVVGSNPFHQKQPKCSTKLPPNPAFSVELNAKRSSRFVSGSERKSELRYTQVLSNTLYLRESVIAEKTCLFVERTYSELKGWYPRRISSQGFARPWWWWFSGQLVTDRSWV